MRILKKQNIEDLVFLDVETTYDDPNFNEDSYLYEAWKFDCMKDEELQKDIIGNYFKLAPLKAEYARIICITMSVVRQGKIYILSFSGEEHKILEGLNDALSRTITPKSWLVGHTVTGFDGPFIAKRCMANQVPLHKWFDVAHLKPWEVPYLDLATLWKGTGFRHSSLVSMCAALGVPSSKEDISGADVPKLFWDGEIKRIIRYCEKDVIAYVQCYRAMCGKDFLELAPGAVSIEADILTYLMSGGRYTDEIEEVLKSFLATFNKADRARAFRVLDAIPTKAKGKATSIEKVHIKELKEFFSSPVRSLEEPKKEEPEKKKEEPEKKKEEPENKKEPEDIVPF